MLAFGEMPRRPHPIAEVDIPGSVVWHVADFRGVSVVVEGPAVGVIRSKPYMGHEDGSDG